MNITHLKQITMISLPAPVVGVLKFAWQNGRRLINRFYFKLFHPRTVMLDVVCTQEGQLNQPVVIDYRASTATPTSSRSTATTAASPSTRWSSTRASGKGRVRTLAS